MGSDGFVWLINLIAAFATADDAEPGARGRVQKERRLPAPMCFASFFWLPARIRIG